MIIGSHVSYGKDGLVGSVKEALSYGANTFMFYTGAPQNTIRKAISPEITKEAHNLMKENNIDINKVICHAPYIINLANNLDKRKYDFSKNFLKEELNRCEELGIKYLVLHPGSSVGIEREQALNNIVDALNKIITPETKTMILLETMAGKGTELGSSLEEIEYIIDKVNLKEKIGICLDTCHLNDAGYNMACFDDFLDMLDNFIGLNYVKCIHINDSKNLINTHKDRHENIGFGTIGFLNIERIVTNKRLEEIPKILETPYVGESDDSKERIYPPYKLEIEMLKKGEFEPNLKQMLREYYKK